jgi:hypothetical protein
MGALQSALGQAPESFQTVCVHLPINIALRIVNKLVREVAFQNPDRTEARPNTSRLCFDVSANAALDCVLFLRLDHYHANLAATFQNGPAPLC